jgi:predicted nucleic acid-binding protein
VILADTSIWVEILNGRLKPTDEEVLPLVTCGPVLQEVLQGLRPGVGRHALQDALLAVPVICDPIPKRIYLAAADLFRDGRRRGLTIRSSVDCLIAAIAIDRRLPVWHRDRDFTAIARFSTLREWTRRSSTPLR